MAVLAFLIGICASDIFSSAEARPSGYLVRSAPEASAKNSLFLEIASCISLAKIGESIIKIIPITIIIPFPFLLSPPLRKPPRINIFAKSETKPTRITTTVDNRISLFPI